VCRPRLFLLLIFCAFGFACAQPVHADAIGFPSTHTPRQMVAQYFADLNAHRFYAAWLLEAPCGVSFAVPNGPGAPVGSEGYPGKNRWVALRGTYARHPILASTRLTGIKRLHIPILERNHILAFGVSGWFRFDYSAVASQPSFNNKHRSGFHVIKIAVWKCNDRWGVEPSYWLVAGGGELNWT
jgi:hypothetical protein